MSRPSAVLAAVLALQPLVDAAAQSPSCLHWFGTDADPNQAVGTLLAHDDGSGPRLFAGGLFTEIGGVAAARVAAFDGSAWQPLGQGIGGSSLLTGVRAMTEVDLGGGAVLVVGGAFDSAGGAPATCVAAWDGTSWSALGGGVGDPAAGTVLALCAFDDGSGEALYVGGTFSTASGVPVSNVARFDGTTWSDVGGGVRNGVFATQVNDLAVFDDGNGPALYAAGSFTLAGSSQVVAVAKWDGSAWSSVGGISGGIARTLAVFDGGGDALYAGGAFTTSNGVQVGGVGRFDGTTWSSLGTGFGIGVRDLLAFDDGSGSALYVGGDFDVVAGAEPVHFLARWDGADWRSVGAYLDGAVDALAVFDDGSGDALYASGPFGTSAANAGRLVGYGLRTCPEYAVVAGCGPHAVAWTAPFPTGASIGTTVSPTLALPATPSGFVATFYGARGLDVDGCGVVASGLGEVLFGASPTPQLLDVRQAAAGVANVPVAVPPVASIVGVRVLLQSVVVDPTTFEASTSDGLLLTVQP
ncbi:MAG: hypothetical protein R3F34_01795 [Planctomycetota bacterium]